MRRAEASRQARVDWLPRAVVAGVSGAVAMLSAFVVAYALAQAAAGAPLAEPLRGWFFALAHNPLTNLAGDNLYVSVGAHFFVATVLALLYGRYVEPRLSGPDWLRGGIFALVPWLLSVLVILPLSGGGLLGAELGAGPLPVIGNLILHGVYGATLGAIYGPFGDIPADAWLDHGPADTLETVRRQEVVTVRGALIGVAAGLLAGLVAIALQPALRSSPPIASALLGSTLIGGAFGALLGSLSGLARSTPFGDAESRRDSVSAAQTDRPAVSELGRPRDGHAGAKVGALLGTVALGPVGMPIGAAAGGVVDAFRPPEGALPGHTHDIRYSPCYDGCPSWHHETT